MILAAAANYIHNSTDIYTHAYTFQYFADASIVIGAVYLCYNNYLLYKKSGTEANIYLLLAAMFICIGTIHLLRMFYGGIPC